MNSLAHWVKAAAAFILTVLTNLAANFANSGTPVPQTWGEWLSLIISTAAVTAGVAMPRNKQTPEQVKTAIDKDLTPSQRELVGKHLA